jgi:YVTN family beta-propeller protein
VIDATGQTLLTTIDLSQPVNNPTNGGTAPAVTQIPDPAEIVFYQPAPGVADVWVTDRANNLVYIIDEGTNAVVARIGIPTGAGGVQPRPEGIAATSPANQFAPNTVFVALPGTTTAPDNRIAIINAITKTLTGTITLPAGSRPTGLHVSLDTQFMYVTNFGTNNTSVIDLGCIGGACIAAAGSPVQPVPGVPPNPAGVIVATLVSAAGLGPFRVTAIDQGALTFTNCNGATGTPGNRVYVADQTTSNVSIFTVIVPQEITAAPGAVARGAAPCTSLNATVGVNNPPGSPDRFSTQNHVYVPVPASNEIRVFQGDQVIATIR